MSRITPEFLDFFIELAGNNHKEWFDAHRKRYETVVKRPFEGFVAEVVARLKADEPAYAVDPKKAIFRINRDIRFSKDKTPYKTQMGASINPGGEKISRWPGLYFEVGPGGFHIGGGAYFLERPDQERVRAHIRDAYPRWKKALSSAEFVSLFPDGVIGEAWKRLPPGFENLSENEPLIWKKQWYWWAELSPEQSLGDAGVEAIVAHHQATAPLRALLTEALID